MAEANYAEAVAQQDVMSELLGKCFAARTVCEQNRHPDAILKVGGPKFPNGGACPMVLLGGILF